MKRLLIGLAFALGAFTAVPCHAMTCAIQSVVGVSLGSYDVFSGSPLDSTGSIVYRCDSVSGSSVTIQLSRGSAASYLPRTLLNGAFELEYNLYLDASRTNVWGDGSSGTSQYGPLVPAEGTDTTVTVYGRIPAGQNAQAGNYSDTVVVTVVF